MEEYKASMRANMNPLCYELRDKFSLHIVTDCKSLYDCVTHSNLPEDKRAAIEVLAIREIALGDFSIYSEDPEDQRLRETRLDKNYHWCCSPEQKADPLTKMTNAEERALWRSYLNFVRVSLPS